MKEEEGVRSVSRCSNYISHVFNIVMTKKLMAPSEEVHFGLWEGTVPLDRLGIREQGMAFFFFLFKFS